MNELRRRFQNKRNHLRGGRGLFCVSVLKTKCLNSNLLKL